MDDFAEWLQKCNICGAVIGGENHRWLNEFRAIYTVARRVVRPADPPRSKPPLKYSAPRLSGVGFRSRVDASSHRACPPIDPHQRYDDGENIATLSVEDRDVRLLDPSDPSIIPLRKAEPQGRRCFGYLFHDACWTLLTKALSPYKVDVWTLYNICSSFPTRSGLLNWGHDYGGIFQMYPIVHPGGTPRPRVHKRIQKKHSWSGDEIFQLNPLCLPFLSPLLNQVSREERLNGSSNSTLPSCSPQTIGASKDSGDDCFSILPPELRQMLLCHLQTPDVLNLFLASRTFFRFPILQDFWISRFHDNFEFSSIFEAWTDSAVTRRSRDWVSLFVGLKRHGNDLNFRNRKRIWDILQPIVDNLALFSGIKLRGDRPSAVDDELLWKDAGSPLKDPGDDSFGEERVLFTRTAGMSLASAAVVAIYVSMVRFGDVEFVSGLRFVDACGDVVELGYVIPGKEICLEARDPLSDTNDRDDDDSFVRFHLAVSTNGIRALAGATASGSMTAWAGSPQHLPRMRILLPFGGFTRVRGAFDGLKLISLGIAGSAPLPLQPPSGEPAKVPLRDSLRWLPEIPPENLDLNEESTHVVGFGASPYSPAFWIHFGGFQGTHLPHVVRLSVWMLPERYMGIEVEYDREVKGDRVHTLGECHARPNSRLLQPEKASFEIDGPGGEFVADVRVGRFLKRPNYLKYLQIITNRGRSITFPDEDRGSDVEFVSLVTATEREEPVAITGLYATVSKFAVINLASLLFYVPVICSTFVGASADRVYVVSDYARLEKLGSHYGTCYSVTREPFGGEYAVAEI
ncbi:hypothetical protein AJ79_07801 [Helicocarpus griseus UAMH5409]|uniref:DUF7600 domain-containing protein n=1 Tax=Helicocarpus griseus UAMH5409 TaxID=1447875 RepID=A0A2B7WR60_9EURO|nr:hypothetical protein AJ79_07801 [Helicocarpus griseus UAMH5409]